MLFLHFPQLEYVIGCFHFAEGEYRLSHRHLTRTQELLARVQGHCQVDRGKLRGFLLACEGMLGKGEEGGAEEKKGRLKSSSVISLEESLRAKDYQVSFVHVLFAFSKLPSVLLLFVPVYIFIYSID